jgi:hypothetical protein
MTFLSRLLGLARDIVIARFFSASDAADAFFVAFKIPNFLRRLFAEGAFSLAFVPVLTEYRNNYTAAQTRDLIDRVAGTLGFILLLLSLFGVIASPLLIGVFAAGFIDQPAKFDLTADMLRITFPYILLISMTAMSGGMLNTWKRFAVPAFTPVLLNLSMIGCAVYLSPRLDLPITALAWGVLIAGVAQLLFQLPFLYREGLLPRPKWGWRHEGVQKIIRLMIPALFGSSVAQINLLFDTFIASFLVTGSVSWLYYSDRLLEFPLGVFGIALATVVLPNLSEAHYKKGATHFNDTLRWAIQLSLLIAVPATFGLFLLAQPILATLFQYGAFSANDSIMAAHRCSGDDLKHAAERRLSSLDGAIGIHRAARRPRARHHRLRLFQRLPAGTRAAPRRDPGSGGNFQPAVAEDSRRLYCDGPANPFHAAERRPVERAALVRAPARTRHPDPARDLVLRDTALDNGLSTPTYRRLKPPGYCTNETHPWTLQPETTAARERGDYR